MKQQLKKARSVHEAYRVDIDSFKKRVIQAIELEKKEGSSPKRDGWTMKKIVLVCASVVAIGFSTGVAVSPSFANYISSFLKPQLDTGIQHAANAGFAKLAEASATDQGITVQVAEVLADPARLIISTHVKSDSNDVTSAYALLSRKNKIYLTDANGTIVSDSYSSYHRGDQNGYFQFVLNDTTPTKLLLHLDASEIRLKDDRKTKTGSWTLTIPIDMEKSMAATKVVPLNQTYATEKGLIVQAKSLAYTPSAARLTLESEWTPEAQKRLDQFAAEIQATDLEKKQIETAELQLRILDHAGQEIAGTIDSNKILMNKPRAPLYQSQKTVTVDGKRKIVYEIVFVPEKLEQELTFEMLGLTLYEPAHFVITIDPSSIKNNPITKQKGESSVSVTNLYVQKNPETGEDGVALDLTLSSRTAELWDWVLIDEKGQSYTLNRMHDAETCSFTGDIETCKSQYFVKGMTKLPKEAKLTIRLTQNKYDEKKWELKLPANASQQKN